MPQPTPEQMTHWPPPNYDNPVTRVSAVLGVLISTTVLMLLFLAGRLYSRTMVRAPFGLDDWTMVAAAVLAVGITLLGCIACNYGNGYHSWDIKPEWILVYSKIAYTAIILLAPCVSLTKISICITYLRIFPSKTNKLFCQFLIAYLFCWMVTSVLAEIFQCTPVGSYWDVTDKTKKCINLQAYLFATAATNSLSDILVYLWPARQLWIIQLPLKQRLGLIFVFTLGCVVCIAGIIRMWNLSVYFASIDAFWEGAIPWITHSIEYNLGIICGCLPGIKPLLTRFSPAIFGSSHHTSKAYTQSRTVPQSFPFQTLSGVGDGASAHAGTTKIYTSESREGNGTWPDAGDGVSVDTAPEHGIRVVDAMTVRVEMMESDNGGKAKGADAGSEEWIISPEKST